MPYDSVDSLPEHVKKYSQTKQRQWMHVFNSVYAKVLRESKDAKQAEGRAFQAANSVLKKNLDKEMNVGEVTHRDRINFMVDSWLGNMRG